MKKLALTLCSIGYVHLAAAGIFGHFDWDGLAVVMAVVGIAGLITGIATAGVNGLFGP